MDFGYQKTFLRSALAKDPFCLGELGPEDVLRIESQFPTLFERATDKSDDEKPQTVIKPTFTRNRQLYLQRQQSASLNKLGCKCLLEKLEKPPLDRRDTKKPFVPSSVKVINKLSPFPSKFSKNTKPPLPPFQENQTQRISRPLAQNPRIQQGSKLIAVSDLKKVLEEILFDQERQKKHFSSPRKLPSDFKSHLNLYLPSPSPTNTNTKSIREFFKENSTGFDRNEIIKEIRKFSEKIKANQNQNSPKSPSLHRGDGEGDKNLSTKNYSSSNKQASPKNRKNDSAVLNSIQKSPYLPQTMSAPGFLRQTILKSSNFSPKPKPMLKDRKRSVKFEKCVQIKTTDKSIPSSNSNPPTKEVSKETNTNKNNSEVAQSKGKNEEIQEISITTESSDLSMNSTPIVISGIAKRSCLPESIKENFLSTDPFTSYQQIKLARNLATKYEKIGLLRKKHEQHTREKEKAIKPNKVSPKISSVPVIPIPSESPVSNFNAQNDNDATTNNNNVSLKTKMLEKIAKEMIYVEVVKYLDDIKCKEIEEREEIEEEKSYSDTFDILLSECEGRERLSEIEEASEINLSTPSLTPSTPRNIQNIHKPNVNGSTEYFNEIATPDLTISKNNKNQPKQTPGTNNDNTDCSEISDFVCSERISQTYLKTPKKKANQYEYEEAIIETPNLSLSPQDKSNTNDDTLSSIFQEKSPFKSPYTPSQSTLAQLASIIKKSPTVKSTKSEQTIASSLDYILKKSSTLKSKSATNFKVSEQNADTIASSKDFNELDSILKKSSTAKSKSITKMSEGTAVTANTANTIASSQDSKELVNTTTGTAMSKLQEQLSMMVSSNTNNSGMDRSKYEMLSEGEFIGDDHKSPGELSLSIVSRYLSQGLMSPLNNSTSCMTSIAISEDDKSASPMSELEIVNAIQPAGGEVSTGEYLQQTP